MTGEVVLSAALRNNLLSLQRTQSSIDKTQSILSTGLKVASALDNPQSFFAAQSLKNRSSDLSALLDGIGQSIQTIKTADTGVSSLTKLVEQASSIVDSARDAITSGSKEASVTGNVDLSAVTDITTVSGVNSGGNSRIYFEAKNADNQAVTFSSSGYITLAAGDSIDQIVTKINDLTDTASANTTNGQQILKASVDSAGHLKITALNGAQFSVYFDSDGDGALGETSGANQAADSSFAAALGFGSIARSVGAESATLLKTGFTAASNTKLVSAEFFEDTTAEGYADASDLLTDVRTTSGGSTARFAAPAGNDSSINITVNGNKTVSIGLTATQTIQGLVDTINNDAQVGNLIRASYSSETGKLEIEAIASSVSTVSVGVTDGANAATGAAANFGWGVDGNYTSGATDQGVNAENFVLASSAAILSQYEDDYNTIRDQIDALVNDASYRGVNLLKGDTLDTYFNEDRSSKLSTTGADLTSASLGIVAADFSRLDTIETASEQTRSALTGLRSFGSTLANSLSVIQTRQDFTTSLVNTLNEGSDKLTLADQNEEGAKLLALQTRQQLGVTALSLAAQAQQSVLRLF